jgi:hypothetical protein
MGARDEVLEMFRSGLDPIRISEARGTTVQTTIGYLEQLVGRGRLRSSDVLFSIPEERRAPITRLLDGDTPGNGRLTPLKETLEQQGHDVTWDELRIVVAFHQPDAPFGAMYEDVRGIECELHRLIRRVLEERFGDGEAGWWRQGVPLNIRQECQDRREEDPDPAPEPWCYTDLKHLERIVDRQWQLVAAHLPVRPEDKRAVLQDLARLNQIRNQVMHPVRAERPSEEDFEFVRALRIRLGFRADLPPSSQSHSTETAPMEAAS